jgi:AbrB family looped-hinge helix DNA binding protein
MSSSTLSSKGQLVIPIRIRKALNLRPRDKVELTLEGHRVVLERQSPHAARLTRGKFGRPVLVAALGTSDDDQKCQHATRRNAVSHLLEVNFLVACGWQTHADHVRASRWLTRAKSFATCAVSEIGFLRISLSPAFGASFTDALAVLQAIVSMRGHRFVRDGTRARSLPSVAAARMSPTRIWSSWHEHID